jgi:hypothetical protein
VASSTDLLKAAEAEEQSLLAALRLTPLYQRLEAVRGVISAYNGGATVTPVARVRPRLTDASGTIALGGERGTKTAAIINGAVQMLRSKGKRATSGEITKALEAKGVVAAGTSSKLVSSYLSNSLLFDNDQDKGGYGLKEWPGLAAR